jgi:HAD superfamily hydrolase (TIGR01490 family)
VSSRVAVFDVDGTLLRGDCLWLAARRSRGALGQLIAVLACLPWLIAWQLRLVSTGRFKQQTIAAFGICGAVNRANAAGRVDWLLNELRDQLRPEALLRLRWHQQRGDRVLLCSASPRLLLQPLADWLGVELLCTELAQEQGQWLPRLASPNCKGPEKVQRLEQHLGPLEGLTIEAYGDSKGDRELLQAAALPHYRSFLNDSRPYPAFSLGPLLPVVAMALLGYGLLGIWSQGDQLVPLLRSLWPQISLGLLLVLLGYAIRYGRWRLLLAAVNQHPPVSADARIWMGSYAFTATPGKSGEAVRSLLLKQECGVPVPPTLMALVVERFTDGAAVLLLLLINLPLLLRWQVPLAVPISLGVAALIVGWLVLRSPWGKAQLKSTVKRLLPRKLASAGGAGLEPGGGEPLAAAEGNGNQRSGHWRRHHRPHRCGPARCVDPAARRIREHRSGNGWPFGPAGCGGGCCHPGHAADPADDALVRHRSGCGMPAVAAPADAVNARRIPWLGLVALVWLAIAAAGVVQLSTVQQQAMLKALQSLVMGLPVLYGVVGLSYAGRYWRWRLLLGRLGIGTTNWPDLLGWFRGFALTATPAKVGELSRVQLLHGQLGYPRLPLVHVFVAERCADVIAVALLLLVLMPAQVLGRLPALSSPWLLGIALLAGSTGATTCPVANWPGPWRRRP